MNRVKALGILASDIFPRDVVVYTKGCLCHWVVMSENQFRFERGNNIKIMNTRSRIHQGRKKTDHVQKQSSQKVCITIIIIAI